MHKWAQGNWQPKLKQWLKCIYVWACNLAMPNASTSRCNLAMPAEQQEWLLCHGEAMTSKGSGLLTSAGMWNGCPACRAWEIQLVSRLPLRGFLLAVLLKPQLGFPQTGEMSQTIIIMRALSSMLPASGAPRWLFLCDMLVLGSHVQEVILVFNFNVREHIPKYLFIYLIYILPLNLKVPSVACNISENT